MPHILRCFKYLWAFVLFASPSLSGAVTKIDPPKRIVITNSDISISGVIGSSLFQGSFTIQAAASDVEELVFSPSNLREVSEGKVWQNSGNVQITPDTKIIKKGRTQEYVVSIQNISQSGIYDGTIAISYKGQPSDAQDKIKLSVHAMKPSAVPPQILLRFEKCIICLGNTDAAPVKISLDEANEKLSQEMENGEDAVVGRLAPLTNSDDRSQVIFPDLAPISKVTAIRDPLHHGLVLESKLNSPEVEAGKYTGTLVLHSKNIGMLSSVPVEIQVRYPAWLAWVLLVLGIFISLLVSWWNTIGKKKNAIQSKAYGLSGKLTTADITGECRRTLRDMLEQVGEKLSNNDLEEAEKVVKDIGSTLITCQNEKKALRKKAAEVEALVNQLASAESELKTLALQDSDIIKKYLPTLKSSLEKLKNDIDHEVYSTADETLNSNISSHSQLLSDLTTSIIKNFRELEKDLADLVTEFRKAFGPEADTLKASIDATVFQSIKERISNIISDTDSMQAAARIMEANNDAVKIDKAIRNLVSYVGIVTRLKSTGVDVRTVEAAIERCKASIMALNVPQVEADMPNITKALEETTLDKAGVKEEVKSVVQVLEARVRSKGTATRTVIPFEVPGMTAENEIFFLRWAREFSGFWKPSRREAAVNVALWILIIPTLAVLGYSQLYSNNPVFGSKNVWQEYLTLFLWGFSIQTGTATVSDVIKSVRGS